MQLYIIIPQLQSNKRLARSLPQTKNVDSHQQNIGIEILHQTFNRKRHEILLRTQRSMHQSTLQSRCTQGVQEKQVQRHE